MRRSYKNRFDCAFAGLLEDGNTHLKLGDLAVEITRHHSLAEELAQRILVSTRRVDGSRLTSSIFDDLGAALHAVWRCAPQPSVNGLFKACRFWVFE